jgi:type I restriction enzyme R subunit
VGTDYGDFDLICHIAFDQPPSPVPSGPATSRSATTSPNTATRRAPCCPARQYADEGIVSIENNNVPKLDPFNRLGTPVEIINGVFGGKAQYEAALQALETELFKQVLSRQKAP